MLKIRRHAKQEQMEDFKWMLCQCRNSVSSLNLSSQQPEVLGFTQLSESIDVAAANGLQGCLCFNKRLDLQYANFNKCSNMVQT